MTSIILCLLEYSIFFVAESLVFGKLLYICTWLDSMCYTMISITTQSHIDPLLYEGTFDDGDGHIKP